jgi:hypothetical protein
MGRKVLKMRKREQVIRIVAEDDLEEIPDGGRVRVPMMLMDAAYHQPGYRYRVSDETNKSAKFSDLDTARDAARAARDAWIKQTCEAWKHPRARDAAQPDAGARPEEILAHERGEPVEAALLRGHMQMERGESERRRNAAWNSYKDRLSRAWMGRADPREADRIMRQGEQWRGGR